MDRLRLQHSKCHHGASFNASRCSSALPFLRSQAILPALQNPDPNPNPSFKYSKEVEELFRAAIRVLPPSLLQSQTSEMASEVPDPERHKPSFLARVIRIDVPTNEIENGREPLISGESSSDSYSVRAAILPFLFPALGGLMYGYDIGATSGATISLQSATLSGTTWYNLSSVEIGLVVSGSLYGALIGSVLAFTVADFLGRRKELILASVLYLVGALLTALAPIFPIMVIGRIVFGIGIGLLPSSPSSTSPKVPPAAPVATDVHADRGSFEARPVRADDFTDNGATSVRKKFSDDLVDEAMHAAPMYIAETAPSQIRGRLISLKEFFIVIGMLFGYIASSLYVDLVAGWRYMYVTSVPICLFMGVGMWWLPPSPRWLLLRAIQGKGTMSDMKETAICSLCQLRGQAIDGSASEQIDLILAELSYDGQEKGVTLGEIFQGKCLKALIIGAGLVFFQQVTGQPSVLYYAAVILQSAGFSAASDATRVSVFLGILKLVMTGVAVMVVDRVGRRPLLIGGVSGIAISLFLLSSYYTLLKNSPIVAVVALLLYVGCYQLSFGPIGWLMISEIFPLRLRGRGLSVAVLVNFASNALVTFAFSPLEALLGTGLVFLGFGVIAILSLLFIFFFIPETKGLTLEEIEAKIL